MIYKDFKGLKLSALGLGAMRFPTLDGKEENIDKPKVKKMVDYAFNKGINYFDTAWGYHGGHSEEALGEALKPYPRDSYFLADKFPGYDGTNFTKIDEIFNEQLRRTGAGYFDFYLFHNVCEKNIDNYLDPAYGLLNYLIKKKNEGIIRHLGFSCHGALPCLERFLDAYADELEFCQIQLNYLDWDFQDAKSKVALLNERHIPIWVMEPLRGGKLALPSEKYKDKLNAIRPGETPVSLGFKFLESIEGVGVILSGMSNMEQLKENIELFSVANPLNEQEKTALLLVAGHMLESNIPCTSCHYCTPKCPVGLDIPHLISLYNEHLFTGDKESFIPGMILGTLPKEKRPSACIACKSCEAVCPQGIKIHEIMADFASKVKAD